MNQRTKELWLIPTIISLATGIALIFLELWLAGTPVNPSLSFAWIKLALFTSLPMWVTLVVLFLAVFVVGLFLSLVHTAEVEKLKAKERGVEKPSPVLHTSWRGDSVWGWATPHPEEDPIYMVRGDVTLVMDNIAEAIIITGAEIEGAESVGNFDNFQLNPDQPETRGMRIYFRGKAPKGIDDYTVQLVFKDLRGNRYPTAEHRFKPLSISERVSIERGHL